MEIIEEAPRLPGEGNLAMAKVFDYLGRSDIDTLLVSSLDVLPLKGKNLEQWRRDLAWKHGVIVLQVG